MTWRLRILELPSEVDGDKVTTPYVAVLDNVGTITPDLAAELKARIQAELGARGVIIIPEPVDLP